MKIRIVDLTHIVSLKYYTIILETDYHLSNG
jgi:hypothetical protein